MNCKPGDLALLIASRDENVGAIVKVIRPTPEPVESRLNEWVCESTRPLLLWNRHEDKDFWDTVCVIEDHRLRPVSGLPMTEWDELEVKIEDTLRKLREARV